MKLSQWIASLVLPSTLLAALPEPAAAAAPYLGPNVLVNFGAQVSPEQYGARGDGVADDTTAIQATIDTASARGGARVYFMPLRKYRVTRGLFFKSNVLLVSDQTRPATIFATKESRVTNLITATGISNFGALGLSFLNSHNPGEGGSGNVILISRNTSNFEFNYNRIASSPTTPNGMDGDYYLRGIALDQEGIQNGNIAFNSFEWLKYGVLSNSTPTDYSDAMAGARFIQKEIVVNNNVLKGISGDGINFNNPGSLGLVSGIYVHGNNVDVPAGVQRATSAVINTAGFGVAFAETKGVTVYNNVITGCRWQCIHLEDEAQDVLIQENTLRGPGINGGQGPASRNLIHVLTGSRIMIRQNRLSDANQTGVFVTNVNAVMPSEITVLDNTIERGGNIAVYGQTVNGMLIQGNVLRSFRKGVKIFLDPQGVVARNLRIEGMSEAGIQTSRVQDRFAVLDTASIVMVGNGLDYDLK